MLPAGDRLLLGPGPSPVSKRVLAALSAAPRSHLDPDLVALLDDIRARLGRVFRASDGALSLAISGTGTSGMEATVANLAESGRKALVIVTGYFGVRLAEILTRYGAEVDRIEVEWGRAVDPEVVARALETRKYDLVAIVHAETSTGVRNPVAEVAAMARAHDALVIVDAVTSLGAMPVEVAEWYVDACFSCTQKGLGAPSGLAPVTFSRRALERRVRCRSFAFDLGLLEAYWIDRKYHHTISAPLIYALAAALAEVESEGLEERWRRHQEVHDQFAARLTAANLSLLPPPAERSWSVYAVVVPDDVDEAEVRRTLLVRHNIEIGAGLGPLAGRIWRVGLMGSGATAENVAAVMQALADARGQ